MPFREAVALIERCDSFVFIESIFAHCSSALKKSGVVVFNNTSPFFFGYAQNINIYNAGGCDIWPCNRPLGALLDFAPGYLNPKTREKVLWSCTDQKCSRITVEEIMRALNMSLGFKKERVAAVEPEAPVVTSEEKQALVDAACYKGNAELDKLRDAVPPELVAQGVEQFTFEEPTCEV